MTQPTDFKQTVFDLIYEEPDLEKGINKALAYVGECFGISRVYIFENSEDNTHISNTFEWCAPGLEPKIDSLQHLDLTAYDYASLFDKDGLFLCPDVSKLSAKLRSILEPQGVSAITQYALFDKGVFYGFVGFDDCAAPHPEWQKKDESIHTLIYISRLLSICLIKERNLQKAVKLHQELGERLALEKELREKITEAANARSEMFSRVSHDMRTPLNGILGSVALALDCENLSPEMLEYLHEIQFSGNFLLTLINDILDTSKIESGTMELFPEPYRYIEFIDNMTKMIAPLCRSKGITLNMNPLPGDVMIYVDKIRFQQIFFNIFSNAVKYTPAGGTIDHYTEITPIDEKHIDCKCHIIDNGIGMSEEFQKKMFVPYSRENQSKGKVEGTGLGLNIANRLAHLMGGELLVKSKLGEGTEVIIHTVLELILPEEETASSQNRRDSCGKEALAGRHILLCEDHPLNIKIATRLLEKCGVTVTVAENGEVGLHCFSTSRIGEYDAILMDMRMPVMDGLTATKAIRALKRPDAAAIPIIAMTANGYDEKAEQRREAGLTAHIDKPVVADTLYKTLLELLPAGYKKS